MTYEESAALMRDFNFKGRIMVAALKFADAIMIEVFTVPGHTSRLKWAQQCFAQPDQIAGQLQPPVVNDPAVQLAGADIEDAALQAAVEGVVNKTV